ARGRAAPACARGWAPRVEAVRTRAVPRVRPRARVLARPRPTARPGTSPVVPRTDLRAGKPPFGGVAMALPLRNETWEGAHERQGLAPRQRRSILPRMGNLNWRAIRHASRLSVGERRDLRRDLTGP